MASGINNFTGLGRLVKDPVLYQTKSGTPFTKFTLAISRPAKADEATANRNAEGNKKITPTDYIQCSAWDRNAVFLSKYGAKGALVGIVGTLQTGSYVKEGQRVYTWEVITKQVSLYEFKKAGVEVPEDEFGKVNTGYVDPDDLPF